MQQFVNVWQSGAGADRLLRARQTFLWVANQAKEQPVVPTEPSPDVQPASQLEAVTSVATHSSLYPCGGDLPPCEVKQRESGGNYSAVNPSGCGGYSCGGAWQFDPRTWNGYGGYEFAQDAPPEVQDAKARELFAGGAGCGHWASCS